MSPHAHAKMPIEMLREEHEVILGVLSAFERLLDRIADGKQIDAATLEKAVTFFRGFADGCHHHKEETLLFPALLEVFGEGGPTAVMLEEHEEGRGYLRGLAAGIPEAGSGAGRREVLANGRALVELLRTHIDKENEVLFPLAVRMLPPDAMHGLAHAFEDAEAELGPEEHARFVTLAAEIERAAGA
jgi:hemerythrin-like domain-containing protein